MKRYLSGLWILLCVVCVAQTVAASGAQRRAKVAFNDGTELFEQQKFSDAARRFRDAYEIRPNWKLLYNIGQCEAAARRYGVALELFESYMAAGGDNIDQERTRELIGEMERLRNLVGFLDFQDLPMGA
jgi:tetratricopeptide (TPR) repeat protein